MVGSIRHLKGKHGRRSRVGEGGHELRLGHLELELPSKQPSEDVKKPVGNMGSELRGQERAIEVRHISDIHER